MKWTVKIALLVVLACHQGWGQTATPTLSQTPTRTPTPNGTPFVFCITDEADDVSVSKTSNAYVPTGSVTVDSAAANVTVSRSVVAGDFTISNGLWRWNTGPTLAGLMVTSAALTMNFAAVDGADSAIHTDSFGLDWSTWNPADPAASYAGVQPGELPPYQPAESVALYLVEVVGVGAFSVDANVTLASINVGTGDGYTYLRSDIYCQGQGTTDPAGFCDGTETPPSGLNLGAVKGFSTGDPMCLHVWAIVDTSTPTPTPIPNVCCQLAGAGCTGAFGGSPVCANDINSEVCTIGAELAANCFVTGVGVNGTCTGGAGPAPGTCTLFTPTPGSGGPTQTPTITATVTPTPGGLVATHFNALELTIGKGRVYPLYSRGCIRDGYAPRHPDECRCSLYAKRVGGQNSLNFLCPNGIERKVNVTP